MTRAAAGLFALVAAVAWPAGVPAREPGDMDLGSPRAPVTVIEYASVGCPHCAEWANAVFPAFKSRYVATGKVRFVVREMTTGDPTLASAGFLLARCAGPGKYFQVIDEIFRRQASMFEAGSSPAAVLGDIAHGAGLDETAFDHCLDDQATLNALNARVEQHYKVDKVDSTPTFVVGGRRLVGYQTLPELAAAIRAARHGR